MKKFTCAAFCGMILLLCGCGLHYQKSEPFPFTYIPKQPPVHATHNFPRPLFEEIASSPKEWNKFMGNDDYDYYYFHQLTFGDRVQELNNWYGSQKQFNALSDQDLGLLK